MNRSIAALMVFGLIALQARARADVLYAKEGGRAMISNVRVVEEKNGKVYYQDKTLKVRAFPKKMIGRIEEKRCDVHVYLARLEKAESADEVVALVEWAQARKFRGDAIDRLYKRALELDPDNEAANKAMGRVQYDGAWMTPAEKAKREADSGAAEMRAKGLVPWKGKWVTPEDKEQLERGLVKYRGRWMTEDQVKRAQGFVKHEGRWIKKDDLAAAELIGPARRDTGLGARLLVVQTEHFAVLGDLPQPQLQELGGVLERTFSEWLRLFPDTADNILEGKCRVFVFRKAPPYQRLVRAKHKRLLASGRFTGDRLKIETLRMKMRLRETNFWEVVPNPMTVHVQMPDSIEALRSRCVHYATNVLMSRYREIRFPTWWLNEGVAYYLEKRVTGMIVTYNVDVGGGGSGRYAGEGGPVNEGQANPWMDAKKWESMLKQLVIAGKAPSLDKMKSKDLFTPGNKLTVPDIAKAYTLVRLLVRMDPKKFAKFVGDAKTGKSENPVEREVSAVIKHYGGYKKIEASWVEYATNGFRVGR